MYQEKIAVVVTILIGWQLVFSQGTRRKNTAVYVLSMRMFF